MTDNRTFSRRNWLRTTGAAVLTGLAGCGGGGSDSGSGSKETPKWKLTAPKPAKDALISQIMQGIRGQVRDAETKLRVELVGVDFADSGVRALGASNLDLTAAPHVFGYAAYHDKKVSSHIDYSGDKGIDRKPVQLFDIYTTNVWWVTNQDDIITFDDLAGKTVGLPLGSATSIPENGSLFQGLLEAAGVLSDVEVVETLYGDIPAAIDDGKIDAAPNLARGGVAPTFMKAHRDIHPVRMGESHRSSFKQSPFGTLSKVDLNEVEAYGQQFEKGTVQTMTYDLTLFAAVSVDTKPTKEITRLCLENADDLQILTEELMNFTKKRAADLSTDVPVHRGAAQYLKSEGLAKGISTPSETPGE